MKKSEKKFDAVKRMRQIRDQLDEQFKGMNFEEQKEYIRARLKIKAIAARKANTGEQTA